MKGTPYEARYLRKQPRGDNQPRGVSFFVPARDLSAAAHQYLGKATFNCGVTIPNHPLPPPLKFANVGPLMLPLDGDGFPKCSCGEHWILYTSDDISVTDFEAVFESLAQTFVPCSMEGGGENKDGSTIDTDLMPSDKLAIACVYCLDDLSNGASDENVKLFSKLYARHICAMDLSMAAILEYKAMADMVASGFSTWFVEDPLLYSDALDARSLLEGAVDRKLDGPVYTPPWVHPFQFHTGEYTDELYDKEVAVNAQAFVSDVELRAKVATAAKQVFKELNSKSVKLKYDETHVKHKGITFTVSCGLRPFGPSDERPNTADSITSMCSTYSP